MVGPTVRDAAIVYDEIGSVADLPEGWTDEQAPGHYRVKERSDRGLFGYNVGPHSWKQFFFPPEQRMWRAERTESGFRRTDPPAEVPDYALIGVRACEIAAIRIQDRVFTSRHFKDPEYENRREGAFIVALNCGEAGGTCFCVSMETGPKAEAGFDLALTELLDGERHEFLLEVGSERGTEILAELPHRAAAEDDRRQAEACVENARQHMGRSMNTDGIRDLLQRNYEHPRWDETADRCLACANCTLVCPTCFCADIEDTSDLSGDIAERWRYWGSCFEQHFSFTHGGSVRDSIKSRYRQWMTHKLSTWFDQFGTSGCVGCGRCITWCPVGIDITEEAAAIRDRDGERSHRDDTPPGDTV